ncbi:MAG: hypothetical protein HY064_10435 [Bacteroidetes bacterium]|nr:hypothetical protein [Bacteroidota bacterium]
MRKIIFAFACASFLFGCGNDNNSGTKGVLNADSTKLSDTTAKVMILPAPLQVSTWMRQYGTEPEMNLLSPAKRAADLYKTDASRALNLGVTLTDLGYSCMYNQRQQALDYLAIVKQLVSDLKLDNIASPYMARLEKSIPQPDSICKLILTLYDEANKQLNESKREKTALFITSGSFLEGLSISLSSSNSEKVKNFPQLLGQQKLMLGNLSTALTYITPDNETQDLYNTFYTLQHYYEPIKVTVANNVNVSSYTKDQIDPLKKKAVQLRDEIVNKG